MKRALLLLMAILFCAVTVQAQDEPNDPFFEAYFDLATGWGARFAEADPAFDTGDMFLAVHAQVLGLDLMEFKSGVALELNLGSVTAGTPGAASYTVWSTNRVEVPGTNGRVYAGPDLKLLKAGDGSLSGDFDTRLTLGVQVAKIGNGKLNLEVYTIEEEKDSIRFAFLYAP